MSIGKKLTALLLTGLLLCTVSSAVCAEELPDLTQKGEITLKLQDGEEPVPGGTVSLYQVGELEETDGEITLSLTAAFQNTHVSLDDLESSALAKELSDYAGVQNVKATKRTISEEGTATFTDLDLGLYLVVQTERNEDYELADPFLVYLPQSVGGEYVYAVTATPKLAASTSSGFTPADEDPVLVETPIPTQPAEETPVITTETPVETASTESASPSPAVTPAATQPTGTTTTTTTKLPQTGQLNWPVPVLVMAGFLLIAFGYRLRREDR